MARTRKTPDAASPAASAHTKTPVTRSPSLDFTVTGLVYCGMMMFMGLAAINSQANLLFAVFGLMVGVLLIAGVISRIILRRLNVRRILPETVVVGESVPITYEFENRKRFWPSLSILLAELEGTEAFTRQVVNYLLHVAPRTTARVTVEMIPKRRGLHRLGRYQLGTSFPFGFVRRAVLRRQEDHVLVYPALARVDAKLMRMARSADDTGAAVRPRPGGMDEFYGVREFRSGENPRLIHWRRSARTEVLVAKEMTRVAPPKIVLLVDTSATVADAAREAAIERAIAMAGSIASQALGEGLCVGLMAWGEEGWARIAPNRGKRHRRELLGLLARLPRNRSQDSRALLDASRGFVRGASTPILLTPDDAEQGLTEKMQGRLMILSAINPRAQKWFTFAPGVDFNTCGPLEEEAGNEAPRRGAATAAAPASPMI